MSNFPHSNGYTSSPRTMVCVATYPARSLWELELTSRWNDQRGAKELRDGDLLSCPEGLTTYTVGTVVSYALKNGDCPVDSVQRATEFGHQLAWINTNASSLSNSRSEPKVCIIVRPGDLVRIEGRSYRVEAGRNRGNLNLRREEADAEQADAEERARSVQVCRGLRVTEV